MDRPVSRAQQRSHARARDEYLRRSLGAVDAQPRIVAEYRSDVGWQRSDRGRLRPETAREMSADGVTMVRVRRRWFTTSEVPLRHFLP